MQFRLAQTGLGNPPVVEAGAADTDATHLQAVQAQGFKLFADNQFGAAAADIHHQPPCPAIAATLCATPR
jgi:hypothetical protein